MSHGDGPTCGLQQKSGGTLCNKYVELFKTILTIIKSIKFRWRFTPHISILTSDNDLEILSVCPSVPSHSGTVSKGFYIRELHGLGMMGNSQTPGESRREENKCCGTPAGM